MICRKCGTFFCWLFEGCLNHEDPYKHFSNLDSKCYKLLFNDVPNLDFDDDHWWNAGGVFVQNTYDDENYDDEDKDNPCIKNFFIYLHYIKEIFGKSYSFVEYRKSFFVLTWAMEVLCIIITNIFNGL